MAFVAIGTSIAVAAGASAGVAGIVGAAAGVGGRMLINKVASGHASGSTGSLPYSSLNIDNVISDARTTAADNYKNSLALEAQNNPGQALFRNASTTAATNLANQNTPGFAARNALLTSATAADNPLVTESADSILQQLRLGSALPTDVQNQIMRASLSHGGQAGLAGSFAQRGLTAQDIGSSSLALLQQRQQAAQSAGSLLEQLGLARLSAANSAAGLDASTTVGLKGASDAYALPVSGLSPTNVGSLYVGNNNAQNQVNQNQAVIDQQNANTRNSQISQLLGFAASAYAGRAGRAGGAGGVGGS